MSVLDQAFIRAYGKDEPELPAAGIPAAEQSGADSEREDARQVTEQLIAAQVIAAQTDIPSGGVWTVDDESATAQLAARPQVVVDMSSLDHLWTSAEQTPVDVEPPPAGDEDSADQPSESESAWVLPPVLDPPASAERREPPPTLATPSIRIDASNRIPGPHLIVQPAAPAGGGEAPALEHHGGAPDAEQPDAAQQSSFSPAWEVDHLQWPILCDRLVSDHRDRLETVGTKLLQRPTADANLIAVTSCRSGEGCTTISLTLARTLAAKGARVLLVDGNFARPGIAASLGLDVPLGWNDAIANRCPLSEGSILALDDQLTLLPLRPAEHDPLACWSSPRAGQLLRFVSNRFDLILVDCGPLENRHATSHLTDNFSLPDRALFVRDVRTTLLDDVHRVVRRLQTVGIETIGIAENFGETAPDWTIA